MSMTFIGKGRQAVPRTPNIPSAQGLISTLLLLSKVTRTVMAGPAIGRQLRA